MRTDGNGGAGENDHDRPIIVLFTERSYYYYNADDNNAPHRRSPYGRHTYAFEFGKRYDAAAQTDGRAASVPTHVFASVENLVRQTCTRVISNIELIIGVIVLCADPETRRGHCAAYEHLAGRHQRPKTIFFFYYRRRFVRKLYGLFRRKP